MRNSNLQHVNNRVADVTEGGKFMLNEASKDSRCTRCGSYDIDTVLGNSMTSPNGYVCRGCGMRWYPTNVVQLKEEKRSLVEKTLTVEERAMAQLIQIAEDQNNDPSVRVEACKVILGR